MKNHIVVSQGSLSADTNRDLQAMYDARRFSPARAVGLMSRQRCNELRASLGMDMDTLNHFFAQCDAARFDKEINTLWPAPTLRLSDDGKKWIAA